MREQGSMFSPGEVQAIRGGCPECGKPIGEPIFGPVQRALMPDAAEIHIACLERRMAREDGR